MQFPLLLNISNTCLSSELVKKSKSRDLLIFYLRQVEGDLQINLFTSFQFRSAFRFKKTTFLISEFNLARHQDSENDL